MGKIAATEALLTAYRAEILRLTKEAANNFGNKLLAEDCLHRARNLQATIDALERLDAKHA
jgi:hypothetical protein